jgi:hypothetical protein
VGAPEAASADDAKMEIDVDADAEADDGDDDGEAEGDDVDMEIADLDGAAEVESRTTDPLTFCDLLFRVFCQIPGIVAKRSKVRSIHADTAIERVVTLTLHAS